MESGLERRGALGGGTVFVSCVEAKNQFLSPCKILDRLSSVESLSRGGSIGSWDTSRTRHGPVLTPDTDIVSADQANRHDSQSAGERICQA